MLKFCFIVGLTCRRVLSRVKLAVYTKLLQKIVTKVGGCAWTLGIDAILIELTFYRISYAGKENNDYRN